MKRCELGKSIIMGKTILVWPTLLTMVRGGQSSCHTACDMCPRSKMASTMRPLVVVFNHMFIATN
jgi:hypothetical protein